MQLYVSYTLKILHNPDDPDGEPFGFQWNDGAIVWGFATAQDARRAACAVLYDEDM